MTASARLKICALVIAVSAMYAVLIVQDAAVASAVSSGYAAMLLTAFVLTTFRKKP